MAKRTQISKYRIVAPWRHKDTGSEIFCLQVFVVGVGWCGVMDDGAIVSFETRTKAREYVAKMKSERTPKGFKRKTVRPAA